MDIVPNPAAFNFGITIANGAINTNGGTTVGNAIAMSLMNGIVWFGSSSAYSTSIYSPSASVMDFTTNTSAGQFNWVMNGSNIACLTSTELRSSTTAGIVGTTAANNANAGSVGEYQSNSTTATNMTTGTPVNLHKLDAHGRRLECRRYGPIRDRQGYDHHG